MSGRLIQKKVLPKDWIKQIEAFDIELSDYTKSQKNIANYLKEYVLKEKDKALTNQLPRIFIKNIIFGNSFLNSYDDLPDSLIKNGMDELRGEKGVNYERKLHSLFNEFITYQNLCNDGYKIDKFNREEGSCDLTMINNNQKFNFEIKFKENKDISVSRLYDIINGYSMLDTNGFLRGIFFQIKLKVEFNYENQKKIVNEVDQFIMNKSDMYDGEYIQIFNMKKSQNLRRTTTSIVNNLNELVITDEFKNLKETKRILNELFIGNGRHLSVLMNKSNKFDNFIGVLSWSIPFHKDIDFKIIEKAFRENYSFGYDLYIYINQFAGDSYSFILEKKKEETVDCKSLIMTCFKNCIKSIFK